MSYGGRTSPSFIVWRGDLRGQNIQGRQIPPTYQSSSRPSLSLLINLKAAKTVGLEVPPTLLARADEVIE